MGQGHEKNGPQSIGRSRGGWSTKLHLVAADDRNAVTWSLTLEQTGDAPEGRRLVEQLGPHPGDIALLMDRAVSIQMMTKQTSGLVGWISRFSGAIQRLTLSMRSIANNQRRKAAEGADEQEDECWIAAFGLIQPTTNLPVHARAETLRAGITMFMTESKPL